MNIKPLFDKIIIKADPVSKENEAGLIIPNAMKDKPREGTVLACGDNLVVKEGDKVMFGEFSGSKFKHDGEELVIMRETDIFAIFQPNQK